jgi:hypothetical protein
MKLSRYACSGSAGRARYGVRICVRKRASWARFDIVASRVWRVYDTMRAQDACVIPWPRAHGGAQARRGVGNATRGAAARGAPNVRPIITKKTKTTS